MAQWFSKARDIDDFFGIFLRIGTLLWFWEELAGRELWDWTGVSSMGSSCWGRGTIAWLTKRTRVNWSPFEHNKGRRYYLNVCSRGPYSHHSNIFQGNIQRNWKSKMAEREKNRAIEMLTISYCREILIFIYLTTHKLWVDIYFFHNYLWINNDKNEK